MYAVNKSLNVNIVFRSLLSSVDHHKYLEIHSYWFWDDPYRLEGDNNNYVIDKALQRVLMEYTVLQT